MLSTERFKMIKQCSGRGGERWEASVTGSHSSGRRVARADRAQNVIIYRNIPQCSRQMGHEIQNKDFAL